VVMVVMILGGVEVMLVGLFPSEKEVGNFFHFSR
jgi:G:T/U-mismatch repair DNA glycosylase